MCSECLAETRLWQPSSSIAPKSPARPRWCTVYDIANYAMSTLHSILSMAADAGHHASLSRLHPLDPSHVRVLF